MLFQMSRKEFDASLDLMIEIAVVKAFLIKSNENPVEVKAIIREARESKDVVVFGPGCTYYGETDIFALEISEDEVLEIMAVFKKYSSAIDGIVTGIVSLAMSIKFMMGALMSDLAVVAKAQIVKDEEQMKDVKHRRLDFLLWKRQKRHARMQFGEAVDQ